MTERNWKIADALLKMTEQNAKWLSHMESVSSRRVMSAHAGSIGSRHVKVFGSCERHHVQGHAGFGQSGVRAPFTGISWFDIISYNKK
jgi:hypothetical protein